MHQVIEDVGDHFAPIEEALANVFILALLGRKEGEQLRELFTLPVRQAGLNLPNPAKRAKDGYRACLECTKAMTASLVARTDLDAIGYASNIKEARALMRKTKALRSLSALKTLCNTEDRYASRHMVRAKETGASIIPQHSQWRCPRQRRVSRQPFAEIRTRSPQTPFDMQRVW